MSRRTTLAVLCTALWLGAAAHAAPAGAHDIIFIQNPDIFISEAETEAALVVERLQHGRGPATVDAATVGGTAGSDTDYQETSKTLSLEPVDAAEFTFPLVNDTEVEALETVEVELSNATQGSLSGKNGTVTVIDNDGPARLSFARAEFSAFENRGTIEFIVIRSGDAAPPAAVTVATSDGEAVAGDDYRIVQETGSCQEPGPTLCWEAGQRIKRFRVRMIDDGSREGTERFTVTLSDPVGAELTEPSAAAGRIEDDETPSSDQTPPVSYFHQPLDGRRYSARTMSDVLGVAEDAGAGLKRVDVALMKKLRDGSCRWLSKKERAFVKAPCRQRVWMKLRPLDQAGNFIYTLPRRLRSSASGRVRYYQAWSRGVDELGNVETDFDRTRNLSRFEIR